MRILHLVEPVAPGLAGSVRRAIAHDAGVLGCRAAIERERGFEHRVCLIGPTSGERRAADLGLRATDRVAPALGIPALAWYGLEALTQQRGRPDAVQCWSAGLVRAAKLAFGDSAPCFGPPDEFPLPEPGPTPGRAALRRGLGLRARDTAVLLIADPASVADARRFVSLLGLLEATGHLCAGIIPAGSRALVRARRYCRDVHLGTRVVVSDLPAWALAPACDLAVLHSAGDEPLVRARAPWAPALARAATIGAYLHSLPVVAPIGSGIGRLLDDQLRGWCIAESPLSPDLGSRLLPLLRGPDLRASVGERVRALAARWMGADRATGRLAACWLRGAAHGAAIGAPPATIPEAVA